MSRPGLDYPEREDAVEAINENPARFLVSCSDRYLTLTAKALIRGIQSVERLEWWERVEREEFGERYFVRRELAERRQELTGEEPESESGFVIQDHTNQTEPVETHGDESAETTPIERAEALVETADRTEEFEERADDVHRIASSMFPADVDEIRGRIGDVLNDDGDEEMEVAKLAGLLQRLKELDDETDSAATTTGVTG